MERERQERRAQIAEEWRAAAEAVAELVEWADGGSVGDDGSLAELTVSRSGRTWDVDATSFEDGGGHARGQRGRSLVELVTEVAVKVRDHPEEEKARQRDQAVYAIAQWANCGHDVARELLDAFAQESGRDRD